MNDETTIKTINKSKVASTVQAIAKKTERQPRNPENRYLEECRKRRKISHVLQS